MFDISFSELIMVGVVATGLLGPKEVVTIIKNTTYYWKKVKRWYNDYLNYLNKELSAQAKIKGDVLRYITDQNGDLQEVYDFNALRPNITDIPDEKN